MVLQIPLLLDLKAVRNEVQLIRTQHQAKSLICEGACTELLDITGKSPMIEHMEQWVITIASCYGVVVSHFAHAFADGSLLCRLVSLPNSLKASCVPSSACGLQHQSAKKNLFIMLKYHI